jgi:uracil-DNA glycosylase family 4
MDHPMNKKSQKITLDTLYQTIVACNDCPRLRKHCTQIAQEKRKAYLEDTYWGRPITGFGDPQTQLMIVGLAPAAHGANRTGRIFTGDRSGDWLYRALHKAGFANQPTSTHQNDGLKLKNAYISCVVKCAPPDNKPSLDEQKNCSQYLQQELILLKKVKVWIALGQISMNNLWPLLAPGQTRPQFQHGSKIQFDEGKWLLLSYHPSQQNTFTKRLTEPMFDSVFETARKLLTPVRDKNG